MITATNAVCAAIEALSDAQLLRIKYFAKWQVRFLGRKARQRDFEDLISEALLCTLKGTLMWDGNSTFENHLVWAIRHTSLAWSQADSKADDMNEYLRRTALHAKASRPDTVVEAREMLSVLCDLFSDDLPCQTIIALLSQGYTLSEIQRALAISQVELKAFLGHIRRKVDSKVPDLRAWLRHLAAVA
jgi:hypothetical protein